jgi:hypothetical protein
MLAHINICIVLTGRRKLKKENVKLHVQIPGVKRIKRPTIEVPRG